MLNHKIVKIDPVKCKECKGTNIINTDAGNFCEDCNRITIKSKNLHYNGGVLPKEITKIVYKFIEDWNKLLIILIKQNNDKIRYFIRISYTVKINKKSVLELLNQNSIPLF